MKIVVFESESWEHPYFQTLQVGHDIVFEPAHLDGSNADPYADAEIISTFIYSDLSRPILDRFKRLRFIATRSVGFDHIDMAYCRERGIRVANVPHYGETTVAEHVFALLLAISHRIPEAVSRTRQGDFSQKGLQGFDLCGKTIGVIGTGNIGKRVIRIANGFGMRVIAYDTQPDEEAASRFDFSYVPLTDLLTESDIISLHVPGNRQTRHLLSSDQFALMKDGVILINTARGNVINVKALLQALTSGKVAAAGLDVLPEEPAIREEAELLRTLFTRRHELETLLVDHVLLHMRNVVITPHSAFNTREAVQRILCTTVENIEGFIAGSARNLVN